MLNWNIARVNERRAHRRRPIADHPVSLRALWRDHRRRPGLEDSRLLESDQVDAVTQPCFMIEVDRRDHAQLFGRTTFVASNQPLSPTSSTVQSHLASSKTQNAIAVTVSKYVGCWSSAPFAISHSAQA